MPFPVAHTVISAGMMVAYKGSFNLRENFRIAGLFVFAGLLPDIDFITVPFLGFGGHRGLTHSFFFAATVSTAVFWLLKIRYPGLPRRLWLYLAITMSIHPICDFFTYDFLVERGGVQLFYPFSLKYFESPYPIFMGIELRYLSTIVSFRSVIVLLYETVLSAAFFFAVLFIKKSSRSAFSGVAEGQEAEE